jgi:hypothetical protein
MLAAKEVGPGVNHWARYRSFASFLVTLLLLCETEFHLIHAFWFMRTASSDPMNAFCLPLMVLLPGGVGFVFRSAIARRGKKDEIGPSALAWLNTSLELLLMETYIVIMIVTSQLTEAALR